MNCFVMSGNVGKLAMVASSVSGRPSGRNGRQGQRVECRVTTRWREALLTKRGQAHDAAVTAALVVSDQPGVQEFVTSSLDSTIVHWRVEELGDLGKSKVQSTRIALRRGPAFSLSMDEESSRHGAHSVLCGTSRQGVVSWEPSSDKLVQKMTLPANAGWVRAVVGNGRWLLSCDCNNLKLWDPSWSTPRLVDNAKLFTGDILGIAVGDKSVYACVTDGSIHSWHVERKGKLTPATSLRDAHEGRIMAIILHKSHLFSAGSDGHLKMWNAATLECVADVSNAHAGKIHCAALGADGLLYTGGDDGLIKRWSPKDLSPVGLPLVCHQHPIRVLGAGKNRTLLSGDASGLISVWDLRQDSS